MSFNIVNIFSVFMVLFAVIDIVGSIPIIIDIKNRGTKVNAFKITLISFVILTIFLFVGEAFLKMFGVDIASFAIAGSFILFFLALEMVLNIEIFKSDETTRSSSIVPLAFPIIAGAGSITTLLSLRAVYSELEIMIALFLNMIVVFLVLKATKYIEKIIGQAGIAILRKVFGIILLAIAVKLFSTNFPNLMVK